MLLIGVATKMSRRIPNRATSGHTPVNPWTCPKCKTVVTTKAGHHAFVCSLYRNKGANVNAESSGDKK